MNTSSSFELSSDTLNRSFKEYDLSEEEFNSSNPNKSVLNEIKNPINKTINQLAKLQVDAHMSMNSIKKFLPIIGEASNGSIDIPKNSRTFKSNIKKSFEAKFYAKCTKCNEFGEIGICDKCKTPIMKKRDNFFIYLPIETQIKKALLENMDNIIDYLDRQRSDRFTDVYDGEIFKKTIGKYSKQRILSLTLNIDGGLVADKSKQSLWPIQLYQNYLHPKIRFLPENILVAGLYYGIGKPDPFELLFPLLRDLRYLHDVGISIFDGVQHDFMPLLQYCSCDLPARAALQNLKYSTGTFGCPVCVHPGIPNKEDRIRYRYIKEKSPSMMRTHNETVRQASLNNKSYGVKGKCCITVLPDFDVIDGFCTDYMHGVFLGIMKRMIQIWTGKVKTSTNFKPLTNQQQIIVNGRLSLLQPYSRISYRPKSLDDIGIYRAIDYKYLLFFYLRYSMINILEKKYIENFEKLSAAIYILSSTEISESEIQFAEELLTDFCDEFEKMYGVSAVTINLHLLRHYGSIVRKAGPLWCYSLFGFETNMGVLTRHSSGGANLLEQIAQKYIISKSQYEKKLIDNSPIYSVNFNSQSSYDSFLIQHGYSSKSGKVEKSTHIKVGNEIFKSISSKPTKHIDYFLEMSNGVIGTAQFYVIKEERVFVLLNVYAEVKKNYHLREVEATNQVSIYPFEFIKEKLILLTFGTKYVVAKEPNKYEKSYFWCYLFIFFLFQ